MRPLLAFFKKRTQYKLILKPQRDRNASQPFQMRSSAYVKKCERKSASIEQPTDVLTSFGTATRPRRVQPFQLQKILEAPSPQTHSKCDRHFSQVVLN
ncbi:unnamed protein product [Caenorhabditis auriculariae]|uniref:Uncharacterized protein n=1 Tax=Caenorhabditis auriculariae TaxID=2777116 RepID=A0A8S1HSU6_9PELO|nr:unnamed protein product [Caenorhabditis auriculariae]